MTTLIPSQTIRIALPVADGRLHGHFGGCREFAIVEGDSESKAVLTTKTVPVPPH